MEECEFRGAAVLVFVALGGVGEGELVCLEALIDISELRVLRALWRLW